MIADLTLRWVVTILFVLSAAETVYSVAIGDRAPRHVVGHGLHFVMSVAMAVMAWPKGTEVPNIPPMIFFLLATVWFVALLATDAGHRLLNGYHALMMFAMAWMYAVMGRVLPGQGTGGQDTGGQEMAPDMQHDMTSMQGMEMGAHQHGAHGHPAWINAVDWFWTVFFALAALWWLYRFFTERRDNPGAPAYEHVGAIGQAMMAAGMAIMFGVML
ncbi:DUF5134 domain-containing protein [Mycolicibacterium palauense]|uniref:DUF5134 domain-containing protein n=1 Tax=Mycolicibacterium palauense TaxID=2034511 RepID=UPI000BFEDCE8|nr:DUF5134 domain-containing protein [Mycolicibacterium palauense]